MVQKKESATAKKTSEKKKAPTSTAKKTVKKSASKTAVKKADPKPSAESIDRAQRDHCDVIEMGGNSFIIVIESARNFFDLSEMRTLVAISHEAGSEKDGAAKLFRWLALHRKDVLIDSRIDNALDPALRGIYLYLVSHYAARK